MQNNTMRDESYKKQLANFIFEKYGLTIKSITPTKRGFYGETWQLNTINQRYYAKLLYYKEYQDVYKSSFNVIEYLNNQGIDYIPTIIKTKDNTLYCEYDNAVLGIFNWIDGENIETDETKPFEYELLANIYTLPTNHLTIRKEDFSTKSATTFFEQWELSKDQAILDILNKYQDKLYYRAKRLEFFSNLCKQDMSNFYITHGDAGGNFYVSKDKNYLVDWDDVLLAPIERDAWVMGFCDWARDLFENILAKHNIHYTLKFERLAYYAYYMFFFWLTWLVKCAPASEIEDYFKGYNTKRIEYADILWQKAQK